MDSKVDENSVVARASKIEAACSTPKEVASPPVSGTFKINRSDSKDNSGPPKVPKRENSLKKETPTPTKTENPVVENKKEAANKTNTVEVKPKINNEEEKPKTNNAEAKPKANNEEKPKQEEADKTPEESNGVGDKIKKFEKAAEELSNVPSGRLSRGGSTRGRAQRLGSDSKDDFPPPATPFKDNVHFDLPEHAATKTVKWQRSESEDRTKQKPSPQKIIKPEFKPLAAGEATIRSPSLGAKLPDQFPSHHTAFRNVAEPDHKSEHAHNNVKPCKFKTKEKSYSVSKGSSYFTRGSEEIWLVKKKDIEEIEERVLDSFRRAGGNICMRSESVRPSSDSGQAYSHATLGRAGRAYARSESLDPAWGARAHTLKRQASAACTCGHDKKPARPRSRSHADHDHHVLDKYETLV